MDESCDLIVIGGGHAGCEAAHIAAKMAHNVLLLTGSIDALGRMSCNPAVGGLAKGQLVKEVDALGGIMGVLADKSGLQFRLLNRSKGPAVRSTRAQCDRKLYEDSMKSLLSSNPNIQIYEKYVVTLILERGAVIGVRCDDESVYMAKTTIITSGTFLNGLIHIGLQSFPAGRIGEKPALGLTEDLARYGIRSGRLKTGTPPRLDGTTIDFEKCFAQHGDQPPPFFSFRTRRDQDLSQLPCHLTYTNPQTHELIKRNLDQSPIFRGIIEGIGPRYCPSIEDKVVRFPDKLRHQLFVEPEGWRSDEIYINGFSSSLPAEIQFEALRTIAGLSDVKMNRPGYAIEYDYFPSSQIWPTMESKIIRNLFFAGQANGTSGYEEAAAQGIMAGINAALKVRDEEPFVLKRSEAYIGVLIDDLTTRNIDEPYRMFTSRAEYRLFLREDNAQERLSHYAFRYGLISEQEYEEVREYSRLTERQISRCERIFVYPSQIEKVDAILNDKVNKLSLADALRIPTVDERDISKIDREFADCPDRVRLKVEVQIKYDGYVSRQQIEIARLSKFEKMRLDENLDYRKIKGLKREAIEKLSAFKPYTLGQASRIAGVTPGDVSVLMVYLKRLKSEAQTKKASTEESKNVPRGTF